MRRVCSAIVGILALAICSGAAVERAAADEPFEKAADAADEKPSADRPSDAKKEEPDPPKKPKPAGEEDPKYEVHEWSLWAADPTLPLVNANDSYPNAMPANVDSSRSRRPDAGKGRPAPIGVMTFYGEPVLKDRLDIDLRVAVGRFVAHLPPAQPKTGRIRWYEFNLLPKLDEQAQLPLLQEGHWFEQLRQLKGMYIKGAGKSRAERFLAYDVELNFKIPLELKGGPDKYEVLNTTNLALADVFVSQPAAAGRRVGWLDVLPAGAKAPAQPAQPAKPAGPAPAQPPGAPAVPVAPVAAAPAAVAPADAAPVAEAPAADAKPAAKPGEPIANPTAPKSASSKPAAAAAAPPAKGVELAMSAPLSAGSPELADLTIKAFKERSIKAGLAPDEVDVLLAHCSKHLFESKETVVAVRLPQQFIDEKAPLSIDPEPRKVVRVAWLLLTNMDPQLGNEINGLVAKLGSAKYAERESAARRLAELGPLAFPALKQALSNSDLEVVHRAEQILLAQNQAVDQPAAAAASAVQGAIRAVFGK